MMWEYEIMNVLGDSQEIRLKKLNEAGKVGWEAYSTVFAGDGNVIKIYLKRIIQAKAKGNVKLINEAVKEWVKKEANKGKAGAFIEKG